MPDQNSLLQAARTMIGRLLKTKVPLSTEQMGHIAEKITLEEGLVGDMGNLVKEIKEKAGFLIQDKLKGSGEVKEFADAIIKSDQFKKVFKDIKPQILSSGYAAFSRDYIKSPASSFETRDMSDPAKKKPSLKDVLNAAIRLSNGLEKIEGGEQNS